MANVKVAVRVRPLNSRERADGGRIAVQVEDKVVTVRNVKLDGRLDGRAETPGDSREKLLEFGFDYCYWSVNPEAPNYASQEEVFQDLGMCVLAGATEGYNVCLFAYGQTGSGKTYTMMGNSSSIGLTPRICQGLFRSGLDSLDGQNSRVEVSFLEIYNERVRDLLRGTDQKQPVALRVREHPEKGPYVQGLTQHVVEDYKQTSDLLEEGISNRITAATHVHDASSRSHAIFCIQYTQATLENNLPSEIVSKINLVDLAGSERADPNYCRDRITEGANINKSLVTLGIVISALAQNSQMCSSSQSINSMLSEGESSTVCSQSSSLSSNSRRHCFIPYRDSALTWLLKDSLGGNSKTIMIATISPSCSSYNETLSTLRYAAHAKNIVNKPRVNEDASVRLIRELREEIDRLKSMLLSYSLQRNPSPSLSDERDSSLSDIVLQNELKVEQLTKNWSESWRDKRDLLEQYSVDINQDRAGVQIHSLQPHLVSMEPDVLSTGVTIYHLREGITRIGPQHSNKDESYIVMPEGSACEIENQNGVVTLKPLTHTACMVNSREVSEPCRLAQGAVITLGGRHKFRFNHPAEAAVLRERRRIIEHDPLFSSPELNALPPNARAEDVGSEEASDSVAPWQRLEEHQHYVECLREEILLEQRRAEKDLEREQAHLRKQHSEIQQWILQEKQRLAAIREKGTLDSGVQTDVVPLPALTGINGNESSSETVHPLLIVGDRKRVVQEELLKHHALRRNENRIRRKRLRYQLERIARKRHLLEAKQELQRLEVAISLGVDGPLAPDPVSPSKRRGRAMVTRRHSFSVDLLSRLYPQHTPIFSQFLRRNRLSESTSSLSRLTFPRRWVSDESLPGKPRGRSNTMPSRCSQGSSENPKIFVKECIPSEERTESLNQLQSSVWNNNLSLKTTMDSDNGDSRKVLPIIKQSSTLKSSPKGEKTSSHDRNNGLETIRKALSRSVGFGIKTALSRVFRKPPIGLRGGKSAKSASRAITQFAAEGKKDKVVRDMVTKQLKSPIKSTVSCDGLDQLMSLKEKKQGCWYSAENLTKKTRRWVKTQQDLTNWVENNGDEVADDSSDCDSLFSVDSLSSAYASALAEQLQQENCEPSETESEDSQMSKDSLVKKSSWSTDVRPARKLRHSICHTFLSSSNPQSTGREKVEKSKEMPEELFRSLPGQKVTKPMIKESSHFSQVTSDTQHSSDTSVRDTETFLALTDAWSSTDAANSPRVLGVPEKLLILSETSNSQSLASLDLSGVTTGSECYISQHFDSTQVKDVTDKETSHMSTEQETVLDYFLSDLTTTSTSTTECTLVQVHNGLLSNLEAPCISGEASITRRRRNNNDVDMPVANTPFKESIICSSWSSPGVYSDKSPVKDFKSNSTKQTETIPLSDESVLTIFATQNYLLNSKQETQFEESCVAETQSRTSDGQKHQEIHHYQSTHQPETALESSNKQTSICSSKDLPQTSGHNLKEENHLKWEPQSITENLINHVEKEVSDEKTLVGHHVQCIEECSASYDIRGTEDEPLEMNIKSDGLSEVTDSLRQCNVHLENESCNVYSRKRSKDSQDDLAGNFKTPKRSCVESLVLPFIFNDSSNSSRDSAGKPSPTEKEITSKMFHQDSKTTSMDSHISMCQNSSNPVACYTSEDKTQSTTTKEQQLSTILSKEIEMQDISVVKVPDVKVVDKCVFESSKVQRIGLTINDRISEVVKEHLNMSLQVEGGEESKEELNTRNETSLATNIDALKNIQNKCEITAGSSQEEPDTSQTFPRVIEDLVDVDNTYDCIKSKHTVKDTNEKGMLDQQGVLGNVPSVMVENLIAEIKNSDNQNGYGPLPDDLKKKLPEANTAQCPVPTNNHPESLSTTNLNGLIDEVISESNRPIQLTLMSTCKQSPEVILSSKNVTVDEKHDRFFLMKSETIPINKTAAPKGTSIRTEDNEFNILSCTQQELSVSPEENSISGVSKDIFDVTASNYYSDAVEDQISSEVLNEAINSVEENMAATFPHVVELNTVSHLDSESVIQYRKKNEHLCASDQAENVQSTDPRPAKTLAYKECAGGNQKVVTQKQLHSGQKTNTLNETKDKIVDLEKHTCLGKQDKDTIFSKSCQALTMCTSELRTVNQTQIIQSVIMNEKPLNCPHNDDLLQCKEDHRTGKKICMQCVNVEKENRNSDQLQSQDLSKSLQRPEQTDMSKATKPKLKISASRSLKPKENNQVKIESTENANEGKQHGAIKSSRLVFSRCNEERQRVKPKRFRKAHFTAPLSSSTDSTPDSSLDEIAKSRAHKCGIAIPTISATPLPGKPKSENRNISSDESSTSLSIEISPRSVEPKSKHHLFYETGSYDSHPYIGAVSNEVAEDVRQKNVRLTAKPFQMTGLSNDEERIQLTNSNFTNHISHENIYERGKLFEKDFVQNRESILHFGSSDINPFVHERKKDRLLKSTCKSQIFGSVVNISSHEHSSNGIPRCCSMDNGLNVQNSPFSSHLSIYADQKGLSSTLSSTEDSKEHITNTPRLREAFCAPVICNEKILTASGSDSCNDTLDLACSSGQADEIVLVYSSEHEREKDNQDSRKCDHGTQTIRFYEDLEKKNRHRRSSTQVPVSGQVHGTSTTWTSLQNMSEHLSELIVSTSDLLGNIQCMRTGESSKKNEPPLKTCSNGSKVCPEKFCKSDGSTQTAIDVGIQTEDIAVIMKQNKVLQGSSPGQNSKAHEVSVIVKVIGSKVSNVPKQDVVIKSIKDQCDSRQSIETFKNIPDLHSVGSPPSETCGGTLDTVKMLSLETIAPKQHCFNPVTIDNKTSNTFAVCTRRKCTSQILAKDNLTHQHMKPKNNSDKSVLLIDRASSPILTVDLSNLQKGKIKSGTIHVSTEMLSKTNRNPTGDKESNSKPKSHCRRDHFYTYQNGNKSVSSLSLDNLNNHNNINPSAQNASSTEVSSRRYTQNGRKNHSHGVESKEASQATWCSPLSHSHSSTVKHRQSVDLSQNTLLSSTPINHSQRSSMQEYKHKLYKDVSSWSELSKDTLQYQEEDSMSLVLSDCNTDILVSINPLTDTGPLQKDCWSPENLPMHNKFTNWSGISQQPPVRLANKNNTSVDKSPDINTHKRHLRSVELESLGYRYKPELLESADRQTREIERLRKEREQVLSSMQLDLSPHQLSVELTEAKLHYGLGKTDTLLKMLKSSSTTETKQQLYDRHRRSIDGLRKEREDCLQTSRRSRSLSPSKHPNASNHMTLQSQRTVDLPSRHREYLQHLRKEVVEMSRVPEPPRTEGQYPTDIELLLRDYSRAREEAKTEIARARIRLRERTEQEKRRLEQQAQSQSIKDHLRLCTRVSNSTLCTGSNLSLSSGPTSGYNSSNAALLKDGTSHSLQISGVSDKDLRVRSRPPPIPPQSVKAPRAWLSAQDIRVESSSSGYELHSSSSPSSPPGRQRACFFSSPSSISISYQDIADCTLTSAVSEVHLASGGNVKNLLAGNAKAGWRHQGLENGVQTFHRPSSRPSAHGFLGVLELERPMANLWSLIRDHSKTHLYNKTLKSAWTRMLDDTTQLVYLLTDPSNCHMKQPRDFCCLSTESKRDDMWVLAMQSVFEESLPRPSVDTVRGEMFPSAWILQRCERQGRETVTVTYLLQVDLGTPALPQRLLHVVARKQAAVIADLDSFLSL